MYNFTLVDTIVMISYFILKLLRERKEENKH